MQNSSLPYLNTVVDKAIKVKSIKYFKYLKVTIKLHDIHDIKH